MKRVNLKFSRTVRRNYRDYEGDGRAFGWAAVGCTLNIMCYLLDQLNAGGKVHTEIDERPVNTLALVLFLLEHEHVMVKELLQLLVGEVNAKLLEAVEL